MPLKPGSGTGKPWASTRIGGNLCVVVRHGLFEFGPVLRHAQRVGGDDLRLHMETQMEAIAQQISQHHVELFLCGALGDVGDNVVAVLTWPPWSGDVLRPDPKSFCDQIHKPQSVPRKVGRVRGADAAGGENTRFPPLMVEISTRLTLATSNLWLGST